jgi:DNA-directed RNA polymerase specialized sigma24 family protein
MLAAKNRNSVARMSWRAYNPAGISTAPMEGALPMASEQSVTHWIGQLKAGNHAAAQQLWERYFRRLVGLARKKLRDTHRLGADEEDVALSAFDSFCRGAELGRFPRLDDRDDLWRVLVTLAARKVLHLVRDQQRLKRGGGAVLDEAALRGPEDSAGEATGIEQILGREPTPELAAQVAEECQRLLQKLGDDELRSIAVWKMEGDTSQQIGARLQRAPSTIERKLRVIRTLWSKEIPS